MLQSAALVRRLEASLPLKDRRDFALSLRPALQAEMAQQWRYCFLIRQSYWRRLEERADGDRT